MFDITLIHPIINHFTIALFTMAMLLDIIAMSAKKEKLHFAAWINLIFAGAATFMTVISGLLAAENVPHGGDVHEMMNTHQTLGYVVLGCVLLILIWRIVLKGNFPAKGALLYTLFGLAALGIMYTGAYIGGRNGLSARRGSKSSPSG